MTTDHTAILGHDDTIWGYGETESAAWADARSYLEAAGADAHGDSIDAALARGLGGPSDFRLEDGRSVRAR